jgi:histidinol-phosphate aminotransferase
MTMAAGIGALGDEEYTAANIEKVKKTREVTASELRKLGFEIPDSKTNFLFVKHSKITGEDFYAKMKESGILIRHFSVERIKDYNRVTVGTDEQMKEFIAAAAKITEGI